MTVKKIISANTEQQAWGGLSTDDKPTTIDDGVVDFAQFVEQDTGIIYRFYGGRWYMEKHSGSNSVMQYSDAEILTGRGFTIAKYIPAVLPTGVSETLFITPADMMMQAAFVDVDVLASEALLELYECSAGTPGTSIVPSNLNLSSPIESQINVSSAPTGVVTVGDPIDGGLVSTGKNSGGGNKYGDLSFVVEFEVKILVMRLTNIGQSDMQAFIRYRWYEESRQGSARGYTPPAFPN